MDGKDPLPITDSFPKLQTVNPQVLYPETFHDDDCSEIFSCVKVHSYPLIGMAFAGSSLSFQYAATRIHGEMAKLGLRIIGDSEENLRTIITRDAKAQHYGPGEWMSSKLLNPPPPFDITAAGEVICDEMTHFFKGRNQVVIPYNLDGFLKFEADIGLFGYCQYSQSFEILRVAARPIQDEAGTAQPIYSWEKLNPGEILLLGSNEAHPEILERITQYEIHLKLDSSVLDPRSSAIELVFNSIMTDDRFPRIGGKVCKAEVSKEHGFRILEDPDGENWKKPRSFKNIIPRRTLTP